MRYQRFPSVRHSVLWAAVLTLFAIAGIARAGQPAVDFTWSPHAPKPGDLISFTDQSTEHPTSWLWNFGDPSAGALNTSTAQNPFHAYNLPVSGRYIRYPVTLTVSNNDGQSTTTILLTVFGTPPLCQSDDGTMCLNGARFAVTADWTKSDGTTGSGHAIELTGDSGYFWFFDEANIELVVKVLDGCGITNSYWVFAAGLTNVQVVLNVTDKQTGEIYTNTNPQGIAYVPVQATGAFPGSCP